MDPTIAKLSYQTQLHDPGTNHRNQRNGNSDHVQASLDAQTTQGRQFEIIDATHGSNSMVEHLKNEAEETPILQQVNPNVFEGLESKNYNWLERLEAYVCDRFNDSATSCGLTIDLTVKKSALA